MERALTVSVKLKTDFKKDSSAQELKRLCNTAGCEVAGEFEVRMENYNPALFIGSGKAAEIAEFVSAEDIDAVVFNDEITPAQQKNLEEIIPCKIIDRTRLILDIFAGRARTKEGRLQVELAQLNYLLPRLSGKGAAMMQQKGGIGMRGPGERKLEYDRRKIRKRIAKLEEDISAVRRERMVRRSQRASVPVPQVALAGYTNAGKSTILNALTKKDSAYADDKLFATLDPTTRRVRFPSGITALFTDTVGFIQKLPHSLVSAFRATLEETKFADLVLHVADASSDELEDHSSTVMSILNEINPESSDVLKVFNKCDELSAVKLRALKKRFPGAVFISAKTGEGFDDLFERVENALSLKWKKHTLKVPFEKGFLLKEIYSRALVLSRKEGEDSFEIAFMATDGNYRAVAKKLLF